ncbi:caspase family protein [Cryptosporangium aurantiacum]|uniref:Caspase domain-containing protein n=1 Tax=Cryptosporangium aurantiacum TaxID=134849 RepID=A0A1M7R0U6_9ACTN|nr:caspase family protein [Cryptosporangium aurantiacum]SHN38287.1 Caspase domain-containing protein [Cryptosporangium aurantiacum]
MSATVYALLVGIDAYQGPRVRPLHGCKNDIASAQEFLARSTSSLRVETLRDGEATRDAVVDGIRTHLGAAGAGDTAVFWFSGHGSLAPVPAALRHLEPSGTSQTLVCADSRLPGVPDLQDYELATLLDRIAGNGVHVVVILDSCHSGGATRGEAVSERFAPPATEPPAPETLLDEVLAGTSRDGSAEVAERRRGNHVALTACQIHQTAAEYRRDGEFRGAFTTALLNAANAQGADATYRELMVAARCAIEDLVPNQHPLLYPHEHPIADRMFLGGAGRSPRSAIVMRYLRGRWEIDAGSCHGLTPPEADDPLLVGVVGVPAHEARVTRVGVVSSDVEPVGWQPDRGRQYPMALTRMPTPPAEVTVDGAREFTDRLAAAIRTGGPGGGASPYVRIAPGGTLHVRDDPPRILGQDGELLAPPVVTGDPVPTVLRELEHIARWRQIKKLVNVGSPLAGTVDVELIAAAPGVATAPLEGPALRPDADGVIRLRYAPDPPVVFIRLRNRSDRRLYCALLDLTDRYQIHPDLFPGDYLGPGQVGTAVDGRRVQFSLPPGRAATRTAQGRDWLLLLVSDQEFSSAAFRLGRLGEPAPDRSRGLPGLSGVLERLALTALHRDARRESPVAHDWTTSIVEVVTQA